MDIINSLSDQQLKELGVMTVGECVRLKRIAAAALTGMDPHSIIGCCAEIALL